MTDAYEMRDLDIAIVGWSGAFPGAASVDQFWQLIKQGTESIYHFSRAELEDADISSSLLDQPQYVRSRGILSAADLFDPAFFDMSLQEARLIDPQQRLFLEHSYTALEHAGHDPNAFSGSIGVFGGASINGYLRLIWSRPDLVARLDPLQVILGNDKDFLATRIAYKLNLQGPAIVIQSACSTSLVAVHLACQSLLSGDCDMALAGGVSVHVPLIEGYLYRTGGIYSEDGHCRAFDASASGTVVGSGVGVIVLRRLLDAVEDRDNIISVIKGSAVTNDGRLKIGYTAPRAHGQARAILAAQQAAGVTANDISYVETHGTGTRLGDPIEIAGLTEAFQQTTRAKGICAIGSVKTNVGHLDTAAGVTGLIKTALALSHRRIPPSLHFRDPNPEINFEDTPFYVNTAFVDWPGPSPRRAGVSSFGLGGTNAHAVLEEAPVTIQ
ncbi:MAG: beta-ketoacyl synthase N-terminal-like domain-containing protein, partial [Terriglobia bacterium]